MSYINIRKVDEDSIGVAGSGEPDVSLTDGEEIAACARLMKMLDDLPEGEALVIWREIY